MTGISNQATRPEAGIWRGMNRAALDIAYDNTNAVTDSAAFLADWAERSQVLRNRLPELIDRPYGPRGRNRLDIFRSGEENAPLFVFIHGGYWQRNSKEVFSCMAEGLLPHGIDVALPGYTLAPDAGLGEIVDEIHAAIRWLRREGPTFGIGRCRLVVSGWSAGGHLAANALSLNEVDAALPISGIFDLEPIRLGVLNSKLGLVSEDVARLSPILDPRTECSDLVIAYGTDELPELQRQSIDYAKTRRESGDLDLLLPVNGANHFSILEELRAANGVLANEVLKLAR